MNQSRIKQGLAVPGKCPHSPQGTQTQGQGCSGQLMGGKWCMEPINSTRMTPSRLDVPGAAMHVVRDVGT